MIKIQANGDDFEIAEETPLANFVEDQGLHINRVVVELNGEALSRSDASKKTLKNGDRLEIVRIVAGG